MNHTVSGLVVTLAALAVSPCARAQWAVIDSPALVQLVKQVQDMERQIQTARDQLQQARTTLSSMTGSRGMALLLNGVVRNYLPGDSTQLNSVMQGGGSAYTQLAADVRSALSNNAVLSTERLATLSTADRNQVVAARQTNALQQSVAQEALANASGRFATLQSLVDAISSAGDQKAILELQARICAEVALLQNEQTKLQVLYQATQAQGAVDRQRQREQAIAGHGRFETRFQPTP